MAALQCEICGGKLVGKPGGVFECDSCGMEYSTEWAKTKIQEIKGTVKVEGTVEVQGKVQVEGAANKESLLKRGFMALEDAKKFKGYGKWREADGKWREAVSCFDKALDIDPECAEAYLGKLMQDLQVGKREELKNHKERFVANENYKKIMRFGDAALVSEVKGANESILARMRATGDRLAPALARTRLASSCIAAGAYHFVSLRANGTVVALDDGRNGRNEYGKCSVGGWWGIVAVAAGENHTVGLKEDGTVVAVGNNDNGQCEVSGWRDIVAIAAGRHQTVGLKSDGTVVVTGNKYDVSGWRDIVAIAAGPVGLKSDGTVVAVGTYQDVSGWRDIVAIAAGPVGLKVDGTLAGAICSDASGWRDIVAVDSGFEFSKYDAGLKADGTVVVVRGGQDVSGEVGGWRDIVAIAAGNYYMVGLKSDGTVVSTGYAPGDLRHGVDWKLFNSIDTLEQERAAAKSPEGQRRSAQIAALNSEKATLQTELANLKGLFTAMRRMEVEARLAEIDAELTNLNSNGQMAMQYTCPNCGEYLTLGQSICDNCGQEIAWE